MTRAFLIGVLCLYLAACASGGPGRQIPVINKSPYRVIPAETTVLRGDSLYSVAWRFGLDYQKIARWNGLAKPYPVRPGLRLRLRPSGASDSSGAPGSAQPSPPARVAVVTTTLRPSKPAAPATPSTPPKPAAPKPAQDSKATRPASSGKAPGKWNWPARGKVIGKFSPGKGQNGIRIAGAAGDAVRSAAAGEVVYAGEGLRGYGKLIIVKHSPSYLSAYAHNRKILVAEGDGIRSGQQIAQMGSTGADRTMLHFEIRKDGEPVDPLQFLR